MTSQDTRKKSYISGSCTLEEKLLLERERSEMQVYEGKKMSLIDTLMYLFFIYEHEHKALDKVRQILIQDMEGDTSNINNRDVIAFLFNEYQKSVEQKKAEIQDEKQLTTPCDS
jgi:hypothetical protein